MWNNTRMCAIPNCFKPSPLCLNTSQYGCNLVYLISDALQWDVSATHIHWNAGGRNHMIYFSAFPKSLLVALPAEDTHILFMHWCTPWCSRSTISPSAFFLELGFTGFFHGSACYSQPSFLAISECCIYQGQWDLAGRQESQYVDGATARQPCQQDPYSSVHWQQCISFPNLWYGTPCGPFWEVVEDQGDRLLFL